MLHVYSNFVDLAAGRSGGLSCKNEGIPVEGLDVDC